MTCKSADIIFDMNIPPFHQPFGAGNGKFTSL